MKNKKIFAAIMITVFFARFCMPLFAQNSTVQDIVKRYEANSVFETNESEAVITIQNKLGTTTDTFKTYARKNGDTLIAITDGADKGQKILRLGNSIYLYYPEAEEVIRLQGSALKDSIMGSDYSYDDLTGDNTIEKNYTYELAGTQNIDGFDCYRVIFTAKNRTQKYQKQEVWIDTNTFAARKTILYSASGKPIRQIISTDFITVGKFTIPKKSETQNLLQKDSITKIVILSIKINEPIPAKMFTREELSW